ncbi:M16 family metallopeptidase [Psychrobacter sp. I-STPA6b]|uniref:M16 family metallopeptidase n=1 Tax=Psychrobacter sp. I-STPA6b TaxID=2585718 RepID=UPI001D0CC3C4|nr:pitrilysin family protein [Psychrobacter sp. I-STPA6b]
MTNFSSLCNQHTFSLKTLTLAIATTVTLGLSGCQSLHPHTDTQSNQATTTSTTAQNNRHEYTLDNGLKVIIKEDHRAPVVMSQIWYRVGATDEPADQGGISHLLEHMMFKGTDKVSSNDFERLIAKFGGQNNAFTSYNYTGYYEMFPANRLGLALELEADRMQNLQFDPEAFASERQVVMEERRQRTDDNPMSRSFEQFNLIAMPDSPKGESVIGPMSEIQGLTLAQLQHWYKTWYAPNNATLVIVGDVDPHKALAQVKHYFADIPASKLPTRPSVHQAGFRGYQQTVRKESVQVPVLLMGFNVPSLTSTTNSSDDTAYALALLQDILDGGLSARFESRLVRQQNLLASIGSSYSAFDRGDGLFLIQASPREGVSLAETEDAILAEIERLKTTPITQEELARARTNIVSGLIYSQDSVEGQAQMIGSMQSIGLDDRLLAQLPEKFASITPQQIQEVAKKYLVKDNLTVMQIIPEDTDR